MELQPIKWTTEKRKVKNLIPYEYNPRNLSEEKKAKLRASLKKFDLAEIPVVNVDNVIIAGHQRIVVLMELGRGEELIDVRVPNRALTEAEFKEYNLRSNIQVGEWDVEKLLVHFDEVDLPDLGLNLSEDLNEIIEEEEQQSQFEKEFNEIKDKPKYPIVPKYNEKYSAVIIVAKNSTDLTFLQTILELSREASYKSERIGQTHVLTTEKFQKLWEKK